MCLWAIASTVGATRYTSLPSLTPHLLTDIFHAHTTLEIASILETVMWRYTFTNYHQTLTSATRVLIIFLLNTYVHLRSRPLSFSPFQNLSCLSRCYFVMVYVNALSFSSFHNLSCLFSRCYYVMVNVTVLYNFSLLTKHSLFAGIGSNAKRWPWRPRMVSRDCWCSSTIYVVVWCMCFNLPT